MDFRFLILLTNRNDEETDVAQPIRRLVCELLHEATENRGEITLITRHSHFDGGRHLCVTITADKQQKCMSMKVD